MPFDIGIVEEANDVCPVPPFATVSAVPDQLELLMVFSVASVPRPEMSVFFKPSDEVAIQFKAEPLENAIVDDAPYERAVWKYDGV